MARSYRAAARRYGRSNTAGIEAAMQHIEEARAFSREIGGTDEDVKRYFFSLQGAALEDVLMAYEHAFGTAKAAYAREVLPLWRSGKRKMGGVTAKRLFDLLPPRMPLSKKYELAQNIWRHFGPSSSHSYSVGPETDVSTVAATVAAKLDEVVSKYGTPENVSNRFRWLAAGDVKLNEQLLNHFRQMEKQLAVEEVSAKLPVLQRQVREHGAVTRQAQTSIQVHKHQVSIWIEPSLMDGMREGQPARRLANGGGLNVAVFIALVVLIAWFLVAHLGH